MAIPLGMVFSELITNTIKHGFKNVRMEEGFEKLISVSAHLSEGKIYIDYCDNSQGFDLPENLEDINSMGIQTIISIIEWQLQGSIRCELKDGLTWYFVLENLFADDRLSNVRD